ncbi:hypothetical protein A7sIIA15_01685 [Candidatus Planktophila vernalis]|uniref:Uncharacterized protein n=2 Tax=Candidatus Planktophila vernalis TaxID=1884907 RepID=A0A249KV14_9ACTN|nr:hypothetical protein A7sIIA15_01685 [Candidatus Planktophila vernalis]
MVPTHAATTKATPSPTAKTTAKATAKPTVSPKATAKATKKAVVKKKPRKKVTITPSPKPKWPPSGFKANGDVYAKIPNAKELVGTASNSKILTAQLAQKVDGVAICEKYSCGAVQVASLDGCTWWEVNSKLVGETSATDKTLKTFGSIRTLAGKTTSKQITTILIISQEPLELRHVVTNISAICHKNPATEKIPSTTYKSATN